MPQSMLWHNKHIARLTLFAVLIICSLQGSAATINFASGTDWDVYNADPATTPGAVRLGSAAAVCLNSASSCPPASTVYGFAGTGWLANLAMIPQATWVWTDGITGSTSPSDMKQYYFSKTVTVGTPALSANMWAAADDLVEVHINGTYVGQVGSISDPRFSGQAILASFDILPFLKVGDNTITVRAQNGPAFFGGCPLDCSYATNPAAAVFGGSIAAADAEPVHMPEPQSLVLVASAALAFLGSKRRRRVC